MDYISELLSNPFFYVLVISAMPWIELRGGIPVGIFQFGLNPLVAFAVATLGNIAIIYPAFVFLDWFFHLMEKIPFMAGIIRKTHEKAKPYVEKYGMLGLGVFVAIPLPGTGAYSGALAAHMLGMKNTKAFISIALGVVGAGILVTLVCLFFKESLGFLIKY
ncbi:MAG: small multi-drug export protein [Candidatus Altiarchaeota archaeon]|nr:small multi-drug export protein [Candidatus Altiarchaeota archaeon]